MAATACEIASLALGAGVMIWKSWQDEEYEIASAIDGRLVLSAYGFAMHNAAPIKLWYNEHHTDQIWILKKRPGFCYLVNKNSGKYLNCTNGPGQRNIVSQYEEGDDNSKWKLIRHGNYYIIKHANSQMCVDVPNAEARPEVTLCLWPQNLGNAQDFIFHRVK